MELPPALFALWCLLVEMCPLALLFAFSSGLSSCLEPSLKPWLVFGRIFFCRRRRKVWLMPAVEADEGVDTFDQIESSCIVPVELSTEGISKTRLPALPSSLLPPSSEISDASGEKPRI